MSSVKYMLYISIITKMGATIANSIIAAPRSCRLLRILNGVVRMGRVLVRDDLLRDACERPGDLRLERLHLREAAHRRVQALVHGGQSRPPVRVEEVRLLGPVAGPVIVGLTAGDDVEAVGE